MKHEYRKKPLDFRSWIDEDDVKNGESILRSNGIPEDKVQDVLSEIVRTMFDLEIYEEDEE